MPHTQDPAALTEAPKTPTLWALMLGSLGVVYGDIGTSPLYAVREALHAASEGGAPDRYVVYGVLSLMIWALLLVVTLKYVLVLLNADNNGEGGTLSLMALAQRALKRRSAVIFALGVAGAAMFYGDSIITPAISVLSAVEGIKLITPAFEPYVQMITIMIIVLLFMLQHHGTAKVAKWFGPITAVWFFVMAILGLYQVIQNPSVLVAFNPIYGMHLLFEHGKAAFIVLGTVFLAVTGAEALYADLGHFGRKPIQCAWIGFVLPALLFNYLGQGAMVIANPETVSNPFFLMAPSFLLPAFVGLATVATIIASQAVITGAFSLTQQAIQLGLLPRMEIRHTSEHQHGQIYLPRINLWMMMGIIFLVVIFGSSSALASAYGISVTGAMLVDTLMAFVVIWKMWGVRFPIALLLTIPLFVIDLTFFGSNLLKLFDGAWFPLMVASAAMITMFTWVKGSRILYQRQRKSEIPMDTLLSSLSDRVVARVPGTAVFLTADASTAPTALMHNLKHNKVLHEQNFILSINFEDAPRISEEERAKLEPLSDGFVRVTLRYGFMEVPNVLKALMHCRKLGWKFDVMQTTFFLSRRSLRPSAHSGMPLWQDKLFITMAKNADAATDFFRIPADHVLEVGTHVKI